MSFIKNWPKSLPDYDWPNSCKTVGALFMNIVLSAVFHVARAVGLICSVVIRRTPRPTLLIRTDGIGDALLFEPAQESLARYVSPSELHLWSTQPVCELHEACPTIVRRLIVPRGCKPGNLAIFRSFYWRARIGFELGLWRFDRAVYPVESPEPLGNWLLVSCRAQEKWLASGDLHNQYEWQQSNAQERVTRILETRPGKAHELDRNEYLAAQWHTDIRLRSPKVHIPQERIASAEKLVTAWRTAGRKIGAQEVIGVVAGTALKVKKYPDAQWTAALERLWNEHRVLSVLLGGRDDRFALDQLSRLLGDLPHLRLDEPLHLLNMTAVVKRLDGVLSVDTGLAHIAVSMRVPTVVLLTGGTPGRYFPWPTHREHTVLNHAMPCEGCNNRCHLAQAKCITDITPDDIVEAFMRLRARTVPLEPIVQPYTLQATG